MIHDLTTQKGRDAYVKSLETKNSAKKIKTENIYLNRLKEQYKESLGGSMDNRRYRRDRYNAIRTFCLDTQLLSFNDIEVMEYEISRLS